MPAIFGEKAICLFDPIIAHVENKYPSPIWNLIGNVSGYMTEFRPDYSKGSTPEKSRYFLL